MNNIRDCNKHLSTIDQLYELNNGIRLALYGAGGGGLSFIQYLSNSHLQAKAVFFVDKHREGFLEGIPIIKPPELPNRQSEYDMIVITSTFSEEIEEELKEKGIQNYLVCRRGLLEQIALYVSPCMTAEDNKTSKRMLFMPTKSELSEANSIERYVLDGYLPEKPFITRKTRVTAFGSCFASYIRDYLSQKGYTAGLESSNNTGQSIYSAKSYVFNTPWVFNNTFVIRQQFEWALEGKKFHDDLWYDDNKELCVASEEVRNDTTKLLKATQVFVLTIGLAEVWENIKTKEVFWRAVPSKVSSPKDQQFRLTTVEENINNIESVYNLIKKHCPGAQIVITLSPVPLRATFRPVSCITANNVSKSILRVAIDSVWRKFYKEGLLYYWPSYEIIKEVIHDPYENDNRHIKKEVVTQMMDLFSKYYLV